MNFGRYDLVMAVFPNARGFAHVVFEGPLSPVDWGMSDVRGDHRNRQCLRLVSVLLARYAPDILILRDVSCILPVRRQRLPQLIEAIEALAETKGIPVAKFSREQVRQSFSHLGSPTRYAIVETIAKHIPMFEPFFPPVRKIWKNEDRRMGLFDAAALALTFFHRRMKDRISLQNEPSI